MSTGKLKLDICACFLTVSSDSSRAWCYSGELICRSCGLLKWKQPIKMSGLESALRESDGRPITGILKNITNKTLQTMLWGPSPCSSPRQSRIDEISGDLFYSVSSFQTRTIDININLHSFHIQELCIRELHVAAVFLWIWKYPAPETSAGSSQRRC